MGKWEVHTSLGRTLSVTTAGEQRLICELLFLAPFGV